jgi:two-component system sensor histidine kinase/response regulator
MEGEIGIESAPDHGSTFWFTGRFEKQLTPATTAREPLGHLSGARLLIVDDNSANRNALQQQTKSWEMNITEAETGERALELLRAGVAEGNPYDIALLDLIQPDMNGFQLAEAIKADPTIASVALVLVPTFTKRGHGQRASEAGIAAYLPKPLRQSQLYDCLTTLMARSERNGVGVWELVTRYSLRESEMQEENKIFSNLRILVAEDNPVNQDVALGQLYNLGYRAAAVPNGRELLKVLENDHVDIILMDCQMPEIDGFAATAEIRRREGKTRHTTIIAMTANALNGDPERCLRAGMDDYLSKPVKSEVLRLKLERWTRPGEELSPTGIYETTLPVEEAGVGVIDLSQLAALRLIRQPGRPNLFTELIDLFLNEATSDLDALRVALMTDDEVEIQRAAHRLKGGSANIGATQMAVLSELMESEDPTKDANELMAQLENEFKLVSEVLRTELKINGERNAHSHSKRHTLIGQY